MEYQEILEKLENTDNIKKLNKLLKKLDFTALSIEELDGLSELLKKKDDIYQLYPIKNILEGMERFSFWILGAAFVGLAFVDSDISLDLVKEIQANKTIVLGSVAGASGVLSLVNELIVSVDRKAWAPSDRESEKYYKYKEMVNQAYKLKVNERRIKEEEEKKSSRVKLNVQELQDFFRLVNSKLMSLPDDISEKYVLKANTLVMTYNEKCHLLDKKNKNNEAFGREVKELYLDELIKGLEDILNEILPILNNDSNVKLVAKITETLDEIVDLPNMIEASDLFIASIDKVAQSLNCLDVPTFNKVMNMVANYTLVMLKKDGVNSKSLMFRLNPYFYKALGDRIKVEMVNNSEALGEISAIDEGIDNLTPFNYSNLLVGIYLKYSKENDVAVKKKRARGN